LHALLREMHQERHLSSVIATHKSARRRTSTKEGDFRADTGSNE
jgi:hypothetical protein